MVTWWREEPLPSVTTTSKPRGSPSALRTTSIIASLSANVLRDPTDDHVGDLEIVPVHHQHVAVALLARFRQPQVRRGSLRGLQRAHHLLTVLHRLLVGVRDTGW